ncbi:AAA family ATPase [Candidatus Thiodiazotropha endoloripes]|uniref:AAA family ATPase n=1 Tax=Candidatus Thiodiazotropha endoloripes TaxID=1818881 RepID=UPI00138FD107|nr:DUF3696 domain-containing protein [Candidatus Thiodiazotropha endoloripes]
MIQSFLLLRQTALSSDAGVTLNFGNGDANESVQLGQFNDVLCKHGDDREIEIEFRWGRPADLGDTRVYVARYKKDKGGAAALKSVRLEDDGESYWAVLGRHNAYSIKLGSERYKRGASPEYRPERSVMFPPAARSKLKEHGRRVENIGLSLMEELRRISYLGPIRQIPKRDYGWSGNMPINLGDCGERMADALIASKYLGNNPGVNGDLLQDVSEWLKRMELADRVKVKRLGNSARHEIMLESDGEHINLRDVGVGVSQVLPVITAAYVAQPGTIVIVEEPESHLHPLSQALLAELFVEASIERDIQFIVETHSEHLLRRLQTLVANQDVDPSNVDMYFVEREGVNASLNDLELDEYGRIGRWPDKFFGDTTSEIENQTRSLIERKKKEMDIR